MHYLLTVILQHAIQVLYAKVPFHHPIILGRPAAELSFNTIILSLLLQGHSSVKLFQHWVCEVVRNTRRPLHNTVTLHWLLEAASSFTNCCFCTNSTQTTEHQWKRQIMLRKLWKQFISWIPWKGLRDPQGTIFWEPLDCSINGAEAGTTGYPSEKN